MAANLWDAAKAKLAAAGEKAKGACNWVKNKAGAAWNATKSAGSAVWEGGKSLARKGAEKVVAAKDFVVEKGRQVVAWGKDKIMKKLLPTLKGFRSRLSSKMSNFFKGFKGKGGGILDAFLGAADIAMILNDSSINKKEKSQRVVRSGAGTLGSILGGMIGTLAFPGAGTFLGSTGGYLLGDWIGGSKAVQNFLLPMIERFMPEGGGDTPSAPKRSMAKPVTGAVMDRVSPIPQTQVNDGLFPIPRGVGLNSADQVVALKEGGLMDKRFKEMIKILSNLVGETDGSGRGATITIEMDGREVARSVKGYINRDYDLSIQ